MAPLSGRVSVNYEKFDRNNENLEAKFGLPKEVVFCKNVH